MNQQLSAEYVKAFEYVKALELARENFSRASEILNQSVVQKLSKEQIRSLELLITPSKK